MIRTHARTNTLACSTIASWLALSPAWATPWPEATTSPLQKAPTCWLLAALVGLLGWTERAVVCLLGCLVAYMAECFVGR